MRRWSSWIILMLLALCALAYAADWTALQLREHLVTALVGLILLASSAIRRPLIYHLARARLRRAPGAELQFFESVQGSEVFRRTMTLATLVWGFGLVAEAALACVLVFALSIRQFLIVSPVLGTSVIVSLTAWTYWYTRRRLAPLRRAG